MRKIATPLLVAWILMLSGCSYPHPWTYTFTTPKEIDLVGEYRATRYHGDLRGIDGLSVLTNIQIALLADHTAQASSLPEFDGFGDVVICSLSGPANWSASPGPGTQDVVLHFKQAAKSNVSVQHPGLKRCTNDWTATILGHSAPYSFYLSIGDPSENRGVELIRTFR
jgi:hypothetical protein